MSTTAAPCWARVRRRSGVVAICGAVIPTTRSQKMLDSFSRSIRESTIGPEHCNGFFASVTRHSVYATILRSGKEGISPPQRPMIRTTSGLGAGGRTDDINAASAFFLAFTGPIPLVMRTKSLDPQRSAEVDPDGTPILRTG